MIRKSLLAASRFALAATGAQAQTEIQLWHSMTGALGDKVSDLANRFNATQKDYKVVPVYKGSYPESMTAAIAAYRAGNAPHILQVFEVGTATMMAAKGAVVPVYKLMKDADEKFDPKAYMPAVAGYYTDYKGQHALVPVQQLHAGVLREQGRLQEGGPRSEQGAEDVEGIRRRSPTKLKSVGPGLRLHHRLAVLGARRELLRLAQPADRHEGERHRRHGHRVQGELARSTCATSRCSPTTARRAGSPTPAARNEAEAKFFSRRVRDAHLELGRAGEHQPQRQVRVLGELPAVPRRHRRRAAELHHRRRLASG